MQNPAGERQPVNAVRALGQRIRIASCPNDFPMRMIILDYFLVTEILSMGFGGFQMALTIICSPNRAFRRRIE